MEVIDKSELSGFGTIQVTRSAMRTKNITIADFLSYKATYHTHLSDFVLALQETGYWPRLQYDEGDNLLAYIYFHGEFYISFLS